MAVSVGIQIVFGFDLIQRQFTVLIAGELNDIQVITAGLDIHQGRGGNGQQTLGTFLHHGCVIFPGNDITMGENNLTGLMGTQCILGIQCIGIFNGAGQDAGTDIVKNRNHGIVESICQCPFLDSVKSRSPGCNTVSFRCTETTGLFNFHKITPLRQLRQLGAGRSMPGLRTVGIIKMECRSSQSMGSP